MTTAVIYEDSTYIVGDSRWWYNKNKAPP